MDPKQNPPPNTIKKPSTGIPTRSSGIPAPSVRRSVAPAEVTASQSQAHSVAPSSSADDGTKLQMSSSQKSLGTQIRQPQQSTIPVPSSSLSTSSSSSSVNQSEAKLLSSSTPTADMEAVEMLKNQVKDLTEKLDTLKLKRAEDREKIREVDKLKLQNQQLNEFKIKAQEIISGLNKEIQQVKSEGSVVKEQFESYKEAMNSHEQRLEEMTVDKELAEAKLEELQDEVIKLSERNEELKLELDVLKGEIEMNGVDGAASTFHNKQAEREIENLKAALIKLRDLNVADKNEIGRLKKLIDESTGKLAKLQKENEQLKVDSVMQLSQINELKDQVTATLGSVQMIEQLTEQNLDLEEKLSEMREAIADLEAINDVNDELQENAREEERELRRSLDLSESRVREAERQIELLKYSLADQEKTILKFRELVKQLQDEKDLVTRKLKSKLEEKNESLNKTDGQTNVSFDFKQKFIETQNLAIQVENELNKIELFSNRKYISYLLSFFPENFVKQSGENECLLSLLFFKRVSSKCDFLIGHFKDKITVVVASVEDTNKAMNVSSQLEFFYNVVIYSTLIKLICNKFDNVLNNCNLNVFNNIGSMYYDFSLNEKNFDGLFELLQKDQLDETFSFDNLDRTYVHFETIFKNHLSGEYFDHMIYTDDFLNSTVVISETIAIVLKRLEKLIEIKEDSSEIMLLFKDLAFKNDDNKQNLKKLQRILQKDEKTANKITLEMSDEFVSELDKALNSNFLVLKSLKELYSLISTHKTMHLTGLNDLTSAKQIEEFAYQACDKIYLKDDNGPYENLKSSIKQIKAALEKLTLSLENGEFEKKLSDEDYKIKKYQVNCPIMKSAETYKNILIEAENIKYKLDVKDEEIKELKKTLKIKVDELSEQKLRITLVEKKGETQAKELDDKNKSLIKNIQDTKDELARKEKEHSDTVEALQQELDNLQNERRELKEKLRNTAKKAIFDNLVNRRDNSDFLSSSSGEPGRGNLIMSSQVASPDTLPLIYEINLIRSVNRLLQKNIMDVKKQYARTLCEKLTNLPVIGTTSYTRSVQVTSKSDGANLSRLSKQSTDLLNDLFNSLVNFKVENLRSKTESNENKKNNINILTIKSKISRLEGVLTCMKLQTKSSAVLNKKLVAEISLPCVDSINTIDTHKTIDLNLNLEDIKQLLRKI